MAGNNIWSVLTYSEQNEYATMTLDYWYLTKFPEKRARLTELEDLAEARLAALAEEEEKENDV